MHREATLFTGTVRFNLDPFSSHSDSECLDALRRVRLLPPVTSSSSTSTTLDFPSESRSEKRKIELGTQIDAGGGNFSAGEKQLIALARAWALFSFSTLQGWMFSLLMISYYRLLRDSRIIIFDESTASYVTCDVFPSLLSTLSTSCSYDPFLDDDDDHNPDHQDRLHPRRKDSIDHSFRIPISMSNHDRTSSVRLSLYCSFFLSSLHSGTVGQGFGRNWSDFYGFGWLGLIGGLL